MGRPRVLALLLMIAGLVGIGLSTPAVPGAATTGGSTADSAKLLLLLDSSGSMKEPVGGPAKITIAKRALGNVIANLPPTAAAGMRVYGATVFKRTDPGACSDSQLVVPIGTNNRGALRAAVARYKPYGETPIAYSLIQAARDLGGSGRRTVVLVSDGQETCHTDPCATAAALTARGIDLRFDVIGLGVQGATRSQLQCVAEKGKGTYYDADTAQQITDTLDRLATRAFRPFRLTGKAVRGTVTGTDAPMLSPGQYLDTYGAGDGDRYYRVRRTVPGSTLRVGMTSEASGFVPTASLNLSSGYSTCGFGLDQSANVGGTREIVSAEALSWRPTDSSPCNTAGTLLLQVRHNSALAGTRFELLVTEEAPLASDRGLPPAEEDVAWGPMGTGGRAARPAVPGVSFADAPVLAPGLYGTSILTGEKQVFAVRLGWGQRLQTQVVVAPRTGALAKALDVSDTLGLQLVSSMRGTYRNNASGLPDDTITMIQDAQPYVRSASTPTIRYLNRSAFDSTSYASQPGLTYVVISKSRIKDESAFLVPYTLRLAVIGTAGTGAPTYGRATQSPTPTPSASSTPSTATTPSTPTSSTSAAASSSPAASDTAVAAPPVDQGPKGHGSGGVSVGLIVAIAAAALVLVAAIAVGAFLLGRRRR